MTLLFDTHYLPPVENYWVGRSDSAPNERFFQTMKLVNLREPTSQIEQAGIALIGFCCDEGIIRNLGRPGAKLGPTAFRKELAKLATFSTLPMYDVGNIQCIDNDLEGAQFALGQLIHHCHSLGFKTLVLGGGHETAWGHYLGLKHHYPALSFINFDAHFDLREASMATSGTPYLQIYKDKEKLGQPFHYACIGIQKTSNSQTLFNMAKALEVRYLTAQAVQETSLNWLQNFIEEAISPHESVYLSICLDVFSSAIAPGVSAPQPLGLLPGQLLPLIQTVMKSQKVVSADIVELSPPHDEANRTACLASQLAAHMLYAF